MAHLNSRDAILRTCEAIEEVRLSRNTTHDAIVQSRIAIAETLALLIELRLSGAPVA
jgi:hypothetical protein